VGRCCASCRALVPGLHQGPLPSGLSGMVLEAGYAMVASRQGQDWGLDSAQAIRCSTWYSEQSRSN
jgi:hypothetical protein